MTATIKPIIAAILFLAAALAASAQKYVGGDISLLTKYETNGANYLDHDGNAITQMLPYLKSQELNAMRVRLFVDPSNASTADKGSGVCQDLEYVKALGKRIKDAGFKLMLDLHYSDTWADPAKQWTPKAWAGMDDDALSAEMYTYTKDVLAQMKAAGATPDFIQTGNEISYGMLWGTEDSPSSSLKKCYVDNAANWQRFSLLLANATKACREECADAKIIIHTERVAQQTVLTGFYDNMKTYGIDYDIIGLSYYPYYHGTIQTLNTVLTALETRYPEKDIMIVETGYYNEWQPADVTYDLSTTYPITDDGQKAFTADLIKTLNAHSKVKGLFWWMMEANECGLDWNTSRVTDSWYNAGLWNNTTGRACSALYVLKDFISGTSGIDNVMGDNKTANSAVWHTMSGIRISEKPTSKGVYINGGRKIVVK